MSAVMVEHSSAALLPTSFDKQPISPVKDASSSSSPAVDPQDDLSIDQSINGHVTRAAGLTPLRLRVEQAQTTNEEASSDNSVPIHQAHLTYKFFTK